MSESNVKGMSKAEFECKFGSRREPHHGFEFECVNSDEAKYDEKTSCLCYLNKHRLCEIDANPEYTRYKLTVLPTCICDRLPKRLDCTEGGPHSCTCCTRGSDRCLAGVHVCMRHRLMPIINHDECRALTHLSGSFEKGWCHCSKMFISNGPCLAKTHICIDREHCSEQRCKHEELNRMCHNLEIPEVLIDIIVLYDTSYHYKSWCACEKCVL